MPLEVAGRSHALGEVEPKIGMRHGSLPLPLGTFLVTHVGEYRAAKFAILEAKPERGKVRRKCFDMVIVVLGVRPQILAGKPPGGPSFVKGMAKQIVFRDSDVQFLEKLYGGHTLLGRLGACQPNIRVSGVVGK